MADVVVQPDHLAKLATNQDQASTQAATAASAADNIEISTWVSHGVISAASNLAFTKAAGARKSTGDAMSAASKQLAEKVRTAKSVYASTDDQSGKNIDKQVLDR
ncbi:MULTISPECIES: ESX-1 secretion-associated protein [unclassified Mycobacterium]|uniref:ESX-1 secretion-associated protein n=1 Tax=unclassified Mycobacterium TaxID=2642494 RepID=UPI0006DC4D26|nr:MULTISPECIES: ESX-1 secretion-associated protein [unclassified Mycobacterium]OBG68458.1 hypothetical protein A5702_14210 [Mycobacterium sp. E3339]OBH83161.1 hypothetical protein A5680_12685 [Mycobacterium sp. E2989]